MKLISSKFSFILYFFVFFGTSLKADPGANQIQMGVSSLASFAILPDGKLYAWGTAKDAEIPLGATDTLKSPTALSSHVDDAIKIIKFSEGSRGARQCAIYSNDRVKCWGSNLYGGAGYGTNSQAVGDQFNQELQRLPFVELGDGVRVKEITVGGQHTCVLTDLGKVKCWGSNFSGELGLGDNTNRGVLIKHMGENLPYVDLGSNSKAKQICAGSRQTCAVLETGELKCWGIHIANGSGTFDNYGSLPNQMGDNLKPVDLGEERVQKIACGLDFSCALLSNGKVKCFGKNIAGVLGVGATTDLVVGIKPSHMGKNLSYTEVSSDLEVTDLTCGWRHCCAILENGAAKCWGGNDFGTLGLGDRIDRGTNKDQMGDNLPFINFGKLAQVIKIHAAPNHNCAVFKDQSMKCWGYGLWHQLGIGMSTYIGDAPDEMGEALKPIAFPKSFRLIY